MTSPLAAIAEWDVPFAAAAIVTADGIIDHSGDTSVAVRIASLSKLLTGYAALVACEEGTITLDDPAGQDGCTLRHLLSHAGGYGFNDPIALQRPGRTRAYSNTGIELAADHLASRSDMSFSAYLTAAVFQPLQMESTTLRGSPAFAVHSSVADLALFARELLSPRLIAQSTLDAAVAVQFPGLRGLLPGVGRFDPLDWGLAFERNFARPNHWAGPDVSPSAFGHFGGSGTFLWVDPTARYALVVLTTREFGPWALDACPKLSTAVIDHFADR